MFCRKIFIHPSLFSLQWSLFPFSIRVGFLCLYSRHDCGYVKICMYSCWYVSMFGCVCIYMYMYIYVCLCRYICVCIYMFLFIYIYMYICIYTYIYMCVVFSVYPCMCSFYFIKQINISWHSKPFGGCGFDCFYNITAVCIRICGLCHWVLSVYLCLYRYVYIFYVYVYSAFGKCP